MEFNGFTITHNGNVVTVSKSNIFNDDFDKALHEAHEILYKFPTTGFNMWGCDGIGYAIQAKVGQVHCHVSRVGPRQFQTGLKKLQMPS